jgi:hypothetical protein
MPRSSEVNASRIDNACVAMVGPEGAIVGELFFTYHAALARPGHPLNSGFAPWLQRGHQDVQTARAPLHTNFKTLDKCLYFSYDQRDPGTNEVL